MPVSDSTTTEQMTGSCPPLTVLSPDTLDALIDQEMPQLSGASPTVFGITEVARSGAQKLRQAILDRVTAMRESGYVPGCRGYEVLAHKMWREDSGAHYCPHCGADISLPTRKGPQ
jgi:hypothetical protein